MELDLASDPALGDWEGQLEGDGDSDGDDRGYSAEQRSFSAKAQLRRPDAGAARPKEGNRRSVGCWVVGVCVAWPGYDR